jgi:hypothetical protein
MSIAGLLRQIISFAYASACAFAIQFLAMPRTLQQVPDPVDSLCDRSTTSSDSQDGSTVSHVSWERLQNLMNAWFMERLVFTRNGEYCCKKDVDSIRKEFFALVRAKECAEKV